MCSKGGFAYLQDLWLSLRISILAVGSIRVFMHSSMGTCALPVMGSPCSQLRCQGCLESSSQWSVVPVTLQWIRINTLHLCSPPTPPSSSEVSVAVDCIVLVVFPLFSSSWEVALRYIWIIRNNTEAGDFLYVWFGFGGGWGLVKLKSNEPVDLKQRECYWVYPFPSPETQTVTWAPGATWQSTRTASTGSTARSPPARVRPRLPLGPEH